MKINKIVKYLSEHQSLYKTGRAMEHAYRPALEALFKSINPELRPINDPKHSEYGAPDFAIVKNNDLVLGYVEAKDIPVALDKVEKSEQMDRYYGYKNLILTNYIDFRFFKNGERYGESIKIANETDGQLVPNESQYQLLFNSIKDFWASDPEPIKSGIRLAKIMGGKARRIRDNVSVRLSAGETESNQDLRKIYGVIKNILIHDLSVESFADMYAQTLVYGLFVARFNDDTEENFTRQEARDLVPASNPFLQHFFDHIVGPNFDKRLSHIVNELCEIFSVTDVRKIMEEYYSKTTLWGETIDAPDPVIHFYEDFLKEYDSEQRKKMGAFYTPLPIVRFIVRSVDEILQKEFGLENGLADISKTDIEITRQGKKGKEKIHKVQLLDPATGTGTFLNEVIGKIFSKFKGQEGRWKSYVYEDLLPRIHGFEIMMAPYTIAHLKLSMFLKKTGYTQFSKRLGIYLTNSLEESVSVDDSLFSAFGFLESVADESRKASEIKKEKPIMVVLGNPPYSVSSTNKGEWIQNLIKDYKKDLGEKKINLDDDYIKFIRFAEYFVEKNGVGIVAMITNNSFIDGITHRQMRKHLLETFDSIYIVDLHGNSKKKEKAHDGGKDENVFDIMQGVSINILVKKAGKKRGLGDVYHTEILGKRDYKFETLNKSNLGKINWKRLGYRDPYYFFVPKDFSSQNDYDTGFKINDFFTTYSSGAESAKDDFIVKFSRDKVIDLKNFIDNHSDNEISGKYNLKVEKVRQVKNDCENIIAQDTELLYRPFDIRHTIYSSNSQGVWFRPKYEVMSHLIKPNLAILSCRQQTSSDFQHIFISNKIVERCAVSLQTGEVSYAFPLYLYSDDGSKIPNLKKEIVDQIEKIVGKTTPENILDYIYAVLHSPAYREKYKEFLKIDFPRVPYPIDKKSFEQLIKKGEELRKLHLFESPALSKIDTTYPEDGDNLIEKITYKDAKVFINSKQYFGNVPEIAWNFYIGGYQPAQKWLKDRKGRTLANEEIVHYQKIIVALAETDKIMKEIDKEVNFDK